MLIGRERECERLDELLDRARLGRSAALVLRGEAGIGKTALLDWAAERADGFAVVRALGIESEAELEFAALLDVCRPLLGHLPELRVHQAEALRGALGLGASVSVDRFAIGAATLGLLATVAEAEPLLVIVDDAHWLDRASADALLFAARRLEADRAVVLFATRDDEERPFEAAGLESLVPRPLGHAEAAALLRQEAHVGDRVVERLVEATSGNPLALVELPRLLSPHQLAGEEALADPLPAGASVERAFARRAETLPDEARKGLLVAAVSTSSAFEPVVAALGSLGLPAASLEPAEDAGLVRVAEGRLRFRHPLVRSAVYQAAPASERRTAHRALADAYGDAATEERAWHLGQAALGADEEVAAALERAADDAGRRAGYAAAAASLERAARLTPDPETGVRRLLAAADAAWRAGHSEHAGTLVAETLERTRDDSIRAQALRLHGAIELLVGGSDAAAASFLEAVDLLERSDPPAAVAAAADAVNALVRARRPEDAIDSALRARSLAPVDGSRTDFEATTTLGYALCFVGRYSEAEPHLRRAVELLPGQDGIPAPLQAVRLSAALGWLGRFEDARTYLASAVERARAAGAVGSLPYLLVGAAWEALHASRWNEAEADAGEAHRLGEELGQPAVAIQALGVLTWVHACRGDVERCRSYGERTRRGAEERGHRLYGLLVSACFGLLALSRGRVDDAIEELEEVARYSMERELRIPGVAPQLELAEALVRAGRASEAEAILGAFERSELVSDPFLSAVAARCRGMLAVEDDFDACFRDALVGHETISSPFALARTRLCYGERLRRAGRRRNAREQLHSALTTFEALGAATWPSVPAPSCGQAARSFAAGRASTRSS